MMSETTKIVEQALVDLAFAQLELVLHGGRSEEVLRVLRHVRHAKARLKSIAPEFEATHQHSRTRAA